MTSSNKNHRAGDAGRGTPARAACPICDAPKTERYAPFCSKRCADVDLHCWLTGGYAIPAVEGEGDDETGFEGE